MEEENEIAVLFRKQIEEFALVNLMLSGDIQKNVLLLRRSPQDQTARRNVIKASFSYIEGMLTRMRESSLLLSGARELPVEDDFVASVHAMYRLRGGGPGGKKIKYPSFLDDVKITFRFAAHASQSGFELDVSDVGWDCFRKATDIRNKLMHPKRFRDVMVSEEDIVVVSKAVDWFTKAMAKVFVRQV